MQKKSQSLTEKKSKPLSRKILKNSLLNDANSDTHKIQNANNNFSKLIFFLSFFFFISTSVELVIFFSSNGINAKKITLSHKNTKQNELRKESIQNSCRSIGVCCV